MNKNILICIEQLSSGGVETAVLNKSIAYIKKGYNVFIAARYGIYVEKIKEYGITWIDFDFALEEKISMEKVNDLVTILREYDIGQIHSHHFPCLMYVGLAATIVNVPYNVYIHAETTDVYDWFIRNYGIYSVLLRTLVINAYKIITITSKAADNNRAYFDNHNENQYIVERNSINFSDYSTEREVNEIKKFIIVSRLAEGKYDSVKNGIDLFLAYADKNPSQELKLEILGDGSLRKKLEEYVSSVNVNNYDVRFLGESNNVASHIERNDVVIGIGRCVLEAIAMKRIAIISGINEIKDMVNRDNINDAINSNFTGKAPMMDDGRMGAPMRPNSIMEIVEKLKLLDKQSIKDITDYNYSQALQKLNVINNSYCIEDIDFHDNDTRISNIYSVFNDYVEDKAELLKSIKEQSSIEQSNKNKIISLESEIATYQKELNNIKDQYTKKTNELEAIISSRRWRLTSKIIDPLKNVKSKIERKNNAK